MTSRTALACSLLGVFYAKETLRGKRLQDLDERIVSAIEDFAVCAKIKEQTTKEKEKKGKENKQPTKGK